MCMYVCVCMYVCICCARMCVCVCVCVCVCMCNVVPTNRITMGNRRLLENFVTISIGNF